METRDLRSQSAQFLNSKYTLVILGFAFVLTRINILLAQPLPNTSDVSIYANYMAERERGERRGLSLYEAHARFTRWRARTATRMTIDGSVFQVHEEVEYPPLAIAFFRLPTACMKPFPPEESLGQKRSPLIDAPEQEYAKEYAFYYSCWMLAIDALLFGLVYCLSRKFSNERVGGPALALGVYLIVTMALWPILYTRMDLVLAFLIAASLLLLVVRIHYAWSFAVLAMAINFKLVPVILVPIWVIGSLPANLGASLFCLRILGPVCVRLTVLVGMTIGIFAPFYIADGISTLNFLTYHAGRGLEVGSSYSFFLMLLGNLGQPHEIFFSHGGYNVRSSLSGVLVKIAPFLIAIALLSVTAFLIRSLRRKSMATALETNPMASLAQTHGMQFVRFTLLYLLLFIATNKVFSPQYVLWLIPLASLLPVQGSPNRLGLASFLAFCGMTSVVFLFFFWNDVIGIAEAEDGRVAIHGPSSMGILMLAARNAMLIVLIMSLLWAIRRESRVLESPK